MATIKLGNPLNLTPSEYRALLRQDFYAFIERSFYELNPATEFMPNWHIEVIAAELEACRRGENRRLIINVPPRSLKSQCTSVAFPAWLLGHNPCSQILCATYGMELATKNAMDCRRLMSADWYRRMFQTTRLSSVREALQELTTTQKGVRLATSVGGVVTGRGADFIIIDDPLKPEEALSDIQRKTVSEWFEHTLYSRLNDKRTGCIIIIMQRLHEDDLVGHVQSLDTWKTVRFPAIAEEEEWYIVKTPYGDRSFHRHAGEPLHAAREPLEVVNHLREALGECYFSGQYQQSPAPLGGGMVKRDWFKTYTSSDLPERFELVIQSWDTACKANELNDFSVCTTWGLWRKKLYLLDVLRQRMEYPELKRTLRAHAKAYGAKVVLIEDKASGTQLIQELISDGAHGVTRYHSKLDKIMRLHSATSTIENGFVLLPDKAPWLAQYVHELIIFPKGKYDDQADSTSQALDWYKQRCTDPSIVVFWREEYKEFLRQRGRLRELRELEEKYPV